jgi:hypothetical protein
MATDMLESRVMAIIRRRLLTAIALLVTLVSGTRTVAAQVVLADLNGDGIRDRIEAGPNGAELVIHTSHRHRTQRLRLPDRVVRVVVGDIDRDGRADIIATTRRAGIVVWLNSGRGRFRSAEPAGRSLPYWHHNRSADNSPGSTATDDDVDVVSIATLATRTDTQVESRLSPFLPSRVSVRTRHARPRVSRGPPADAGLG